MFLNQMEEGCMNMTSTYLNGSVGSHPSIVSSHLCIHLINMYEKQHETTPQEAGAKQAREALAVVEHMQTHDVMCCLR